MIWTFTFDEQGGGDCATPAVVVSTEREGGIFYKCGKRGAQWEPKP